MVEINTPEPEVIIPEFNGSAELDKLLGLGHARFSNNGWVKYMKDVTPEDLNEFISGKTREQPLINRRRSPQINRLPGAIVTRKSPV